MKAILTSALIVGLASVAFADNMFFPPVPPGIPKSLVPGARGGLPLPPAPPLTSWGRVGVPGGSVPVPVPYIPGEGRHYFGGYGGYGHSEWSHHGHGAYLSVPVVAPCRPYYVPAPVIYPRPVIVEPPVVYAPAPVCAPAVVYAPPVYTPMTSVGGYYSNGSFSIGFSVGR